MKELKNKISQLNTAYWTARIDLLKRQATKAQLETLAQNRRKIENDLRKTYGDDLTKLNLGMEIKIS